MADRLPVLRDRRGRDPATLVLRGRAHARLRRHQPAGADARAGRPAASTSSTSPTSARDAAGRRPGCSPASAAFAAQAGPDRLPDGLQHRRRGRAERVPRPRARAGRPADGLAARLNPAGHPGTVRAAPVQWSTYRVADQRAELVRSHTASTDRVSTVVVVPGEQAMVSLLGSRDELLRVIEKQPRQRHPRPRQRDHHHRRAGRQRDRRPAVRGAARADQGRPAPHARLGRRAPSACSPPTPASARPRC